MDSHFCLHVLRSPRGTLRDNTRRPAFPGESERRGGIRARCDSGCSHWRNEPHGRKGDDRRYVYRGADNRDFEQYPRASRGPERLPAHAQGRDNRRRRPPPDPRMEIREKEIILIKLINNLF